MSYQNRTSQKKSKKKTSKVVLFLLIIFLTVRFLQPQTSFAVENTATQNAHFHLPIFTNALKTIEKTFKNTENVLTSSLEIFIADLLPQNRTPARLAQSPSMLTQNHIPSNHVLAAQDTNTGAIPGTLQQGGTPSSPVSF